MGITHATAATGTDSGDGRISKNAWNEEHSGGIEEILTGTGDLLYQGAFGIDYALSGTASSPWGSGPTNVNDDNDTTYWQGSENGDIWIKMDLGSAREIAGFRALTSNNNQTYYLQSSTDDSSYTTRYTRALNDPYETGDITLSGGPITARYWRMNPTGNGGGNFWRVHSFELLAIGAPSRLPIGTDNYILRVATNVPAWEAEFDATSPTTQAFGDSAVVGDSATAARRNHKHAMMGTPTIRQAASVPSGAPSGTELPIAFDTTASTGGLYIWSGSAWVKASLIP